MRRHDDPMIVCPFDSSHKMPSARLQWHLVSCKAKKQRLESGLPIFHCQYNYSHIYLEQGLLDHHQEVCPQKLKISNQLEVEENYRLSRTALEIVNS